MDDLIRFVTSLELPKTWDGFTQLILGIGAIAYFLWRTRDWFVERVRSLVGLGHRVRRSIRPYLNRMAARRIIGARPVVSADHLYEQIPIPLRKRKGRKSSAVAYRYTGAGNYYYVGIPARDLTEAEYASLSADQREQVDSGKVYEQVMG